MKEEIDPHLMLAGTGHDKNKTNYFSIWDLEDHCYEGRNFVVNNEHSYYQKIDVIPELLDHSYALPAPKLFDQDDFCDDFEDLSQKTSMPDLTLDLAACKWVGCRFSCDNLPILHEHLALVHCSNEANSSKTCCWEDCSRERKPFKARYLLLRHMDRHIHYAIHKCDQCCLSFTTAEGLRLHRKVRHFPEVRYTCEKCCQIFKTTSDRAHHITRVHMKPRFICPHCKSLYASRTSLSVHIKKSCSKFKAKS